VSGSDIEALIAEAEAAIAAANDRAALDGLRVQYLGKKGTLTAQLKTLGSLPAAERPAAGQAINAAKERLTAAIESRDATLQQAEEQAALNAEQVDVTLPGRGATPGGLHPVTRTIERIEHPHAHVPSGRGPAGR